MHLWQLGMRPFYLLAGAFASVSVALWAVQYCGLGTVHYLAGPIWHAHEMLFGYVLAVISGFLLTAVRNWTQLPTVTGAGLAALAALWVAGRILVCTRFGWLSAAVNAAYPLALAACIALPLIRSGNRRNLFFVGLLVLISCASLATHLIQLGALDLPPWAGIRVGLDIVLFIISVIAGRVIPMFTNNAIAGAGARRNPWVERAVLASVFLLAAADAADLHGAALAAILAAGAGAHTLRLLLWSPFRVLRTPLVWVLHAAYAWVPVYLVLRLLSDTGSVPGPLATHALTIGVIGTITIGMMTRTARGHTGRRLTADAYEVACYLLVLAAGLVRVFAPMMVAGIYLGAVLVSGLLWSTAFALFTIRYWPILTQPRADGLPG